MKTAEKQFGSVVRAFVARLQIVSTEAGRDIVETQYLSAERIFICDRSAADIVTLREADQLAVDHGGKVVLADDTESFPAAVMREHGARLARQGID